MIVFDIQHLILTKFHNCDQISQLQPNFTITTKFHNCNQISQFWPNFNYKTIQDNPGNPDDADNTDKMENADNKAFLCPYDSFAMLATLENVSNVMIFYFLVILAQ